MYIGFQHLHSAFAFLALAVLLYVVIYSLIGSFQSKQYTEKSKKISLIGLISLHTQVLVGLILYFISPLGLASLSGEAMKSSELRLYTLEHPLIMIIAAVLVTIGYSQSNKKEGDKQKYNKILIYYGIALVLVLSRIPWKNWL